MSEFAISVFAVSVIVFACGCSDPFAGQYECSPARSVECPGGQVCVENKCYAVCNQTADCTSRTEACIDSVCQGFSGDCDAHTECPEGWYCVPDGACRRQVAIGSPCLIDEGCTGGFCGADGTCISRPCGNGVLDIGEQCDDGTNDGSYGGCNNDCTLAPYCGDGTVNVEHGEDCDDGLNTGEYATCDNDCTPAAHCGDGTANGPESCDDGNADDDSNGCNANCERYDVCGNGILESLFEVCDDANVANGDYCSADCSQETGYCGDGITQLNEECDAGVDIADGCSSECNLELGWRCAGSPSNCEFVGVFVDPAAIGSDSGTSWQDAYSSLEDALAIASAGSEIYIAQGTYHPAGFDGDVNSSFLIPDGVSVYGGFFGYETRKRDRDPDAFPVILSGDLNDDDASAGTTDNSIVVVKTEGNVVLDSLTIERGAEAAIAAVGLASRSEIRSCEIQFNGSFDSHVAVSLAGLSIFGTTIAHNVGDGVVGAVRVLQCHFEGNSGTALNPALGMAGTLGIESSSFVGNGLGIFVQRGKETELFQISDSYFAENDQAMRVGCGIGSIRRSVFVANGDETTIGGAIKTIHAAYSGRPPPGYGGCELHISDSRFMGNVADVGGALASGSLELTTIVNTIFSGNTAVSSGAAIAGGSSPFQIENAAFFGNVSPNGAAVESSGGSINIANSILDTGLDWPVAGHDSSSSSVSSSLLTATWPGDEISNIYLADPLFSDPDGPDDILGTEDDDLSVQPNSPAIDAGNNSLVSTAPETGEGYATDLADNPRFCDAPGVEDTGLGTGPIVDMGAYEWCPVE